MNNIKHTEDLDQVLAQYAQASGAFDARVLQDYVQRFPQFAEALNRFAQVQLSSVRATTEEIAAGNLTDEELLPMQSKLLHSLQQLRTTPAATEDQEVKIAVDRLASISGAKATNAATIAVFGACDHGEDDLFLLITESPGVRNVPDWVHAKLGGHLSLPAQAIRAGLGNRMAARVQRYSAQGKPVEAEPLTWEEAIAQSITDEGIKQALLKES